MKPIRKQYIRIFKNGFRQRLVTYKNNCSMGLKMVRRTMGRIKVAFLTVILLFAVVVPPLSARASDDVTGNDTTASANSSEAEESLGEQLFDEYGQPIIDSISDAAEEAVQEAAKEAGEEIKESFWEAVKNFFLEIKEMIQEWFDSWLN